MGTTTQDTNLANAMVYNFLIRNSFHEIASEFKETLRNQIDDIKIQDVNKNDHKSITKDSSQKIRFPATQGPNNMIECKWSNCQMSFTTYGRLSDHLKVRILVILIIYFYPFINNQNETISF